MRTRQIGKNNDDRAEGCGRSERSLGMAKRITCPLWAVFIIALSALSRAEQPPHETEILLKAVKIVDVERGCVPSAMDVLVADGHIKRIARHLKVPVGTRLVDGKDAFLIPGLWDMHVHTAGLSADPEWSKDALLPLLVANGVMGVRDMGGNLTSLQNWRDEISRFAIVGPRMVFAGPMLNGESEDPSVIAVKTPDQARQAVDQLAEKHVDFIKILSGLDPDSYFAIVAESKARHLTIVGHVPTAISTAEASEAGQKSIEHILYGGFAIACSSHEEELRQAMVAAMQSGVLREVAKVEDAAVASFDEEKARKLWGTLRQNRTWVVPTLVATFVKSHLDELSADNPELEYLPRSLRSEWTPDKLGRSLQADKLAWWKRELAEEINLVRKMHEAGVSLLAGTDSLDTDNVVGFALAKELELLVQAGLTPIEALQSATIRPAEFLGRTDIGSVTVGKVADLVLLAGDPTTDIGNIRRIRGVLVSGQYLSRRDLDQMLKGISLRVSNHN